MHSNCDKEKKKIERNQYDYQNNGKKKEDRRKKKKKKRKTRATIEDESGYNNKRRTRDKSRPEDPWVICVEPMTDNRLRDFSWRLQ